MIHNEYGKPSGEEVMVCRITDLLRENGHQVYSYLRSSSEINGSTYRRIKAFFSGVYSFSSRRQIRRIIDDFKPDVIQVQNLYPLISPSVLVEAQSRNVPVIMRCANYRLICPNGLLLRDGKICEKCSGHREWWCFLLNCEKDRLKSLGYALRNYTAGRQRHFLDNITLYSAQTQFQRSTLVRAGFPADRMCVLPNMVVPDETPPAQQPGEYVAFVGRLSREKGLPALIEAAKACRDIEFKAAGYSHRLTQLQTQVPENFEFVGHLNKHDLRKFYTNARIIVLCSVCYEGFPSVLLEAMIHAKPIVCSRIGGLPEIVDDTETGLLFEPGDADDLARKIRYLWERPRLCREMGRDGRKKALYEYSPQKYYQQLMAVYEKAIKLHTPEANELSVE